MKTIGMVVAVEMKSVLEKFEGKLKQLDARGFFTLEYTTDTYRLIIVESGAGEIAAAAATQYLISTFGVELIVNFGVVGGLTADMAKTKVGIVERVVHYDFDTSAADGTEVGRYLSYPTVYLPATAELVEKALEFAPDLKRLTCASGDKFIASPKKKLELAHVFGADICEMEAAGIVLTANRSGVPCMLIKIVSDGIEGGAEEFYETKDTAAALCLEIIAGVIDTL
ncbi:MAG: 5'-methylthioadenosine/S-adenosylhomocysteine nucleosidase [Clostridia bacterium]|nr:5'-methylthioadenosine/S-adenosylhomocysteine nucleosidase [Clostridia bacterium]